MHRHNIRLPTVVTGLLTALVAMSGRTTDEHTASSVAGTRNEALILGESDGERRLRDRILQRVQRLMNSRLKLARQIARYRIRA